VLPGRVACRSAGHVPDAAPRRQTERTPLSTSMTETARCQALWRRAAAHGDVLVYVEYTRCTQRTEEHLVPDLHVGEGSPNL
jgi:hypothetical protein